MELIISQPCSEMLHRVKLYPAQFFPVFKENDLKKKKPEWLLLLWFLLHKLYQIMSVMSNLWNLKIKNISLYINLILVLTNWWCPCVVLFLCCWKRMFTMTSVLSWQNSVSLCPASFCTSRPNFPAILVISRLPTFAFQSSIMKTASFFWC